MITYELRIYWYPSEWVTSSSDSLIRYNPLSIAIGYILILILYVFMICVILGKVQLPKWTSVILLLLIIAIFLKNSYCFVINYVGNQYYEFYFPEKKYFIGIQFDDNRTTISELPEEWVYSKINKIELKNGLLTFYRPNRKNYKISESFLFWKLDFGRFDKEIAARKGKYEPSFVANSKGVLMKVGGIAKSNSLYQSFSLPCSCV